MDKKYEIDMTHGPMAGKILLFAIPVMLSGVLQLVFNAADVIVVGKFAGTQALAAVSSTTAVVNLIVNIFIGLSIGVNVLIARFYASEMVKDTHESVHTAITMALIAGVLFAIIGVTYCHWILHTMGCPDDVIDLATLYLRIYFTGLPVIALYNFGSAILRAIGDTQRPLYYLIAAGVINVLLNLFFVIMLHLSVAGVALATIIAQVFSAAMVIMTLMKSQSMIHLNLKELKLYPQKALSIIQVGLPAGIQGSLFSLSNIVIQSSINSFGSIAMAGNGACQSLEGFNYQAMNCFTQACITFTSQNCAVKKKDRVNRTLLLCLTYTVITGLVIGTLFRLFGKSLLSLYASDEAAIAYGIERMGIVVQWQFLIGLMDLMGGSIRGLGFSTVPMFITLIGACLFRVFWVMVVFARFHSLPVLYFSYPISWTLTGVALFICFFYYRKKAFS